MIFWFSGTGNSRWAAQRLGEIIGDERLVAIADYPAGSDCSFTLARHERVGFVFPTYSWGPAPVVARFVRRLTLDGYKAADNYCYALTTCGDDVGLSVQIMAHAMRPALHLDAMFSLQMPNNYVCLLGFDTDPADVEKSKLAEAQISIGTIAGLIAERRCVTHVVTGGMAWLKSRVVYPLFKRLLMSPKPFHVRPAVCTRCGRCVRVCPLHNVELAADGLPQWSGNCAMCLACYHHCPAHAVEYGRATLRKRQYHCPLHEADSRKAR